MSVGVEIPIYDQKRTILCTKAKLLGITPTLLTFGAIKKLIEVILVVSKVGIVDLFVILHQMRPSVLLKTSHMSTHRPLLHFG